MTISEVDCVPDVPEGAAWRHSWARYGPLLVLLWVPLLLAASLVPAVLEGRWSEAGLYGGIGASYVLAVLSHRRHDDSRIALALVGAQGVLTAVALLTAAEPDGLFTLPALLTIGIAVVVSYALAPGVLAAVSVATCGVAVVAGSDVGLAVLMGFVALLSGLGTWATQRLADTTAELARTRHQLAEAAVAAERLRFSRDLHDLLGHTLSVVVVKAEVVRRLAETDPRAAAAHGADIEQLGRSALAEVRRAVAGYREGGLADELSRAASALRAAGVRADIAPAPAGLMPGVQSVLGWVVREGTTNVVRHAEAHRCRIAVETEGSTARVVVEDDGRGARGPVDGSGLRGLSERLREVSGTLTVHGDGPGFVLVAEVPLDQASYDEPLVGTRP